MSESHTIPGSELTLTIESVAFGGKGVARHEGFVYFVEGAVPQDRVRARVREVDKRYADADVIEIISPSPLRGVAPCAVADRCGGCQWQGIPYAQQMLWKTQFVTSALGRIGKLIDNHAVTPVPSPRTLHYRNRVHLKCAVDASGRLQFGYFQRASHSLVVIEQCPIAEPAINAFIADNADAHFPALAGVAFRLELQTLPAQEALGEKHLFATVYPNREHSTVDLAPIIQRFQASPRVFWSGTVFDIAQAPAGIFEILEHAGRTIAYTGVAGQFQQVNREANQAMRNMVLNKVLALKPGRVLDLFSGSGNFSLPLTTHGIHVEGVEFGAAAVAAAKENLTRNRIDNAIYLRGDVEKHLWKCSKKGETFDVAITDPPREGMFKALIPLKNMKIPNLIYISCDPATLARDLGALTKADYDIVDIHAFDFFPQTFHIETLVQLKARR